MFALSPKRRSRIEDEVMVLKVLRPGSGLPTQYLARITLTRTSKITRSIARNEGRTEVCKEARPLAWIELSSCNFTVGLTISDQTFRQNF